MTALCVESTINIDDKTWCIFEQLAKIDVKILLKRLADATSFETKSFADIPVCADDRKYVNKIYGQYGVYMVTTAIRTGIDKQHLVEYLYEKSGVNEASDTIFKHFGNRSFIIKLDSILLKIKSILNKVKYQNIDNDRLKKICTIICEDIDQIIDEEQAFKELKLLKLFYNGELSFNCDEDKNQFLQLTGENGSNCEAKSKFSDIVSIKKMKNVALERSKKWNGLSNNMSISRNINSAANVIVRSCNSLYEHLDALSGYEG